MSHDFLGFQLKSARKAKWAHYFLALLSGAILPIGFAPFHQWYLVLISLMSWHILFDKATPKEAYKRGWWYGFGLFTAGVCWVYVSIHVYGKAPPWLATIATLTLTFFLAYFFAFQAYFYSKLRLKSLPILGFASLWVIFEWLRLWMFTGFPWLYIGYAFIDTPLSGYAPIGSVYLVSFLVCVSSECLYLLLKQLTKAKHVSSATQFFQSSASKQLIIGLFGLWLLGYILSLINWTNLDDKPIKVSLIQGNIDQEKKWDPKFREFTKGMYYGISVKEWKTYQPDIVIWPESAIPVRYEDAHSYFEQVNATANEYNSTLISGIIYSDKSVTPPLLYNSVFAFNDKVQSYTKQRLVPFGEYIPLINYLSKTFPFLKNFPSGVSPGSSDQIGLKVNEHWLAPSVCYEVLYPHLIQKLSKNSNLLFTISNDAWFGRSHGPPQHFQMARMRAIELNRYMIRSTNNGITAIINSKGKVEKQIPTDQRTVLRGEVRPAYGLTPFGFWGITPIIAGCACLLLINIYWSFFRKKPI